MRCGEVVCVYVFVYVNKRSGGKQHSHLLLSMQEPIVSRVALAT